MKIRLLSIALLFCAAVYAQDPLPRQGKWGIYAQTLTDSMCQELKLRSDAVQIVGIRPGSTEYTAGLQKEDILYAINNIAITSTEDLYYKGYLNQLRAEDSIEYHIIREGDTLTLSTRVIGLDYETSTHGDVIYDKVPFKGGYLSTILTLPQSKKKLPAIYFIPGYNCASYDKMGEAHPYRRIIDSFTHLGYAVFRCQKSGMGDSYQTPNCFEIDFHTEQEGFEEGYRKLLSYDFIDTQNIFIFGHSLGGINAPIIAEKFQPKGIIVYGTTHIPWMEYLMYMIRFQNTKLGYDPIEIEKEAHTYQKLLYQQYVLKKTPEELASSHPDYADLLERDFQYQGGDMIFQRHYDFWYQLNDLHLAQSWASQKSHVLSIWGEADFEALDDRSHKDIVHIVNHYHPGHATYVSLPETNHSFIKVGSMEEGIEARQNGKMRSLFETSFNYDIIHIIHNWINNL